MGVSGVATFSGLSINKTGTGYTLSATSGSLAGATSSAFNVTPGSASLTQSTIVASSSSITADGSSTSTITVQLKDANGNNLASSGGTVVVSTTLGTLGTVTDNNNGTYTATLTSATTAGTATVSGTLGGSGNALTSTASVNFVAGAATQIALTTQAVGSASGAAFARQPVVTIQDAFGNTVTSDSASTVSMTVSSGATVIGTATATASSGLAAFTTVGISGTLGTTYTLSFSSGSFAPVTQTIIPALLVSGLARNGEEQGKVITTGSVQSGLGIVFTTGPSYYWEPS